MFSADLCSSNLFSGGLVASFPNLLRLKDQFDCDLEQLKSTVIIDKLEKDGSMVDTIEPSLWGSCGITKQLHKMMLAKSIRRLAGK